MQAPSHADITVMSRFERLGADRFNRVERVVEAFDALAYAYKYGPVWPDSPNVIAARENLAEAIADLL